MKQSPIIEELREDIDVIVEELDHLEYGTGCGNYDKGFTDRLVKSFQSYLVKCVGEDESVNNYKVCGDVFGDVRDVLRDEIRKRGGIK